MFRIMMLLLLLTMASDVFAADPVRIGHFPNITHAQPLVGRAKGFYEQKMAVPLDWKVFNAGPVEMEALIAGHLDIAYVGPNPAVNAYLRTKGKALKIIAGAASGGASLVVPAASTARTPSDFRGKRIASPEFGNTQDVALRHWLKNAGMIPGKDVKVTPIKNADILMLFQQGKLDGAWVPEPWVTRLVREGGGKILHDERTLWQGGRFPTAVVVVRSEFLARNRAVVERFLDAHIETTDWIVKNPIEARNLMNSELAKLVGKPFSPQLLEDALTRVSFTNDPMTVALLTSAGWAGELGFLPRRVDLRTGLNGLFDLTMLNSRLHNRRLPAVTVK